MNRRRFIGTAVTASLLAGCLTDPTGPGTDQDDPAITDREFDVIDAECGTGESRATVDFADETVTVEGSIAGANGCYTARLERASYDEASDELRVAVVSEEQDGNGACVQCIVDIHYTARITFSGGLPGRAVVRHDDDVVQTTERDEGTSSTE